MISSLHLYYVKMKFILILLLFTLSTIVNSQSFIITGYVKEDISDEILISANIYEANTNKGTISNSSGHYSISLEGGLKSIQASYVGYKPVKISFFLKRDTLINFELSPMELDEVIITGNNGTSINSTIAGLNTVPVKNISSIPSFTGEPDVIKAITFLPGISEGREGISDFYVRGGDRGQNLIMLDGAKVYNTNHFGGFISLFNADILKSVDMYKGGFPSRFGGRASSVLDIHTREGNINQKQSSFKVGILQSSILFEGPLNNHKTSYLIALRGSYLDLLTLPKRIKDLRNNSGSLGGYTFLDLNFKINHQVNLKNKIFFNFYSGLDLQRSYDHVNSTLTTTTFKDNLTLNTNLITLGHTLVSSSRTFLKSTLSLTQYSNILSSKVTNESYLDKNKTKLSSQSSIGELCIKTIFEWYPGSMHSIKTGFEISKYSFVPSKIKVNIRDSLLNTSINTVTSSFLSSLESSLFIEDDLRIHKILNLYSGLRLSSYFHNSKDYYFVEPRIGLRATLSKNISAKLNYTRMVQFNHALISNYQGFEREVWIAATDSLPPQTANQYSVGFYGDFEKFNIKCSIEGYYKTMTKLVNYRSPTSIFDDFSKLNTLLASDGEGLSYGLEFMMQKESPKFSGTLAYTLSWSFRKFEEINNGAIFHSRFDRRHDLTLLTRIRLSKTYTLNSSFSLSTGTPFTMPVSYSKDSRFTYGYYIYAGINNMRLPLYHRLDLGLEKAGFTKKGRPSRLVINIYNVYARQNPVYIYYDPYRGKTYQKSLFSIIPSLTYSVDF